MYSAVHSTHWWMLTCATINAEETPQVLCHVSRLVGNRLDACQSLKWGLMLRTARPKFGSGRHLWPTRREGRRAPDRRWVAWLRHRLMERNLPGRTNWAYVKVSLPPDIPPDFLRFPLQRTSQYSPPVVQPIRSHECWTSQEYLKTYVGKLTEENPRVNMQEYSIGVVILKLYWNKNIVYC
jgi:hypothetical protein